MEGKVDEVELTPQDLSVSRSRAMGQRRHCCCSISRRLLGRACSDASPSSRHFERPRRVAAHVSGVRAEARLLFGRVCAASLPARFGSHNARHSAGRCAAPLGLPSLSVCRRRWEGSDIGARKGPEMAGEESAPIWPPPPRRSECRGGDRLLRHNAYPPPFSSGAQTAARWWFRLGGGNDEGATFPWNV